MRTVTQTIPETIGVREFTRNMPNLRRRLTRGPLLVLSSNRPNFVALSPETYQTIVETLEEFRISRESQKYLKEFMNEYGPTLKRLVKH